MTKLLSVLLAFGLATAQAATDFSALTQSFRQTLGELVKADTTNPPGNEARAVAILAKRLKAAGIPYEITDFAPGRQNIVARLKGSGEKKPLLLLAHIDVVGTDGQNWTMPKHEMTEKDGHLYGRGVLDDLGMAVLNLETVIELKKSGIALKRDVILAFTGDEESGGLGLRTLLKERPELVDAEIALNEGGGAVNDETGGPVKYVRLQMAEKTYQDFTLTAKGPTGHSSVPQKENAIYKLSRALTNVQKFWPAPRLIPVTREYFRQRSALEKPETGKAMLAVATAKGKLPAKALAVLEKNPVIAAQLRTTCVTTMLSAGTKVNALPPSASANINCRIMPDETIESVEKQLLKLINDPSLTLAREPEFGTSPAAPTDGEVPKVLQKLAKEIWNVPVIPTMSTGATDSRYLREKGVAAYGFSAMPVHETDILRAHGIDERIQLTSIRPGLEFMQRLVIELAAQEPQNQVR